MVIALEVHFNHKSFDLVTFEKSGMHVNKIERFTKLALLGEYYEEKTNRLSINTELRFLHKLYQ